MVASPENDLNPNHPKHIFRVHPEQVWSVSVTPPGTRQKLLRGPPLGPCPDLGCPWGGAAEVHFPAATSTFSKVGI